MQFQFHSVSFFCLGHSHYILRSTSPPTCKNCLRQEKKAAFWLLFLFFPPTCQDKMNFFNDRYINKFKFGKIDPFSPTSASKEIFIFIFFPPTRQKYACRDPLPVKYSKCSLIAKVHIISWKFWRLKVFSTWNIFVYSKLSNRMNIPILGEDYTNTSNCYTSVVYDLRTQNLMFTAPVPDRGIWARFHVTKCQLKFPILDGFFESSYKWTVVVFTYHGMGATNLISKGPTYFQS